MQLSICAVHDSAAGAYARPFFVPTSALALRSFRDEINRASPDNPMYQHSDDFTLFELGTFDDNSAEFNVLQTPTVIARAKDLKD